MPLTANVPAPNVPVAPPPSRARPPASRRKVNVTADDAAYHGTSTAGVKRGAVERADGEPRGKRKRAEAGAIAGPSASTGIRRTTVDKAMELEGRHLAIDFRTLPTATLHRYLAHFDLIPDVNPSPATAHDPPPPSSLLHAREQRHSASRSPPPLPITPANRPRREPSASGTGIRHRTSHQLDEDLPPPVLPVLADIAEFNSTLAAIAERHFREHMVKEVDTLTSFMYTLKAKARTRS